MPTTFGTLLTVVRPQCPLTSRFGTPGLTRNRQRQLVPFSFGIRTQKVAACLPCGPPTWQPPVSKSLPMGTMKGIAHPRLGLLPIDRVTVCLKYHTIIALCPPCTCSTLPSCLPYLSKAFFHTLTQHMPRVQLQPSIFSPNTPELPASAELVSGHRNGPPHPHLTIHPGFPGPGRAIRRRALLSSVRLGFACRPALSLGIPLNHPTTLNGLYGSSCHGVTTKLTYFLSD